MAISNDLRAFASKRQVVEGITFQDGMTFQDHMTGWKSARLQSLH